MTTVALNVYDLSHGMARTMSLQFLGRQIDYVPHTGVVFGAGTAGAVEYFFGGGIQMLPPHEVVRAFGLRPVQTQTLGVTRKTREEFHAWINSVRHLYTEQTYDLFKHNCNNFSDAAAKFLLGGTGIPAAIIDLPRQVLETPIGQMIAPMLSQQMTQMNSQVSAAGGNFNGGVGGLSAPAAAATPAPAPAAPPGAAAAAAAAAASAAASAAPVAGPPITITVKGQTGAAGTFDVTVPGVGASTGQLRAAIATRMSVAPEAVRIIFMGKVLANTSATVESYGVKDGVVVLVSVARNVAPAATTAAAPATAAHAPAAPAAAAAAAAASTTAPATAAVSSDPVDRAIARIRTAPRDQALTALKTIHRICSNIKLHPMEEKYRKLKTTNAAFQRRVTDVPGGLDCLVALGFEKVDAGEHAGSYVLTPTAQRYETLVATLAKLDSAVAQVEAGQTAAPAPAAGGAAGLAGLLGGLGGAGGMQGLAQMMQNNPQAMQQVQGLMNNPAALQGLMASMGGMGGGAPGGAPGAPNMAAMAGLMQNPQIMQQVQGLMQNPQAMQQAMQMVQNNPQMMQQMMGALGGAGGGGPVGAAQKTEEEILNEAIMRSFREQ